MTETSENVRAPVRALRSAYAGEYWRQLDASRGYPDAFVNDLTQAGDLAALIPEEYGGSGIGLPAAAAILEEIPRSGCNGGACHAHIYTMGTVLRHGCAQQKADLLPRIAAAYPLAEHVPDLPRSY